MKVLVTGTDGFIGVVMGPWLAQRGHEVTGLDTGFYRDGWLYHDGVTVRPRQIVKDLRHVTVDDLRGHDAVVHLAELSNDPLGQLNPEITFRINHQGTVRLAELAKQAGIERFVYASSCSVYGVGTGDEVKTEATPPAPQTAYAECKVLCERDLAALADARFSPTFMRNATAYGASPRIRFDIVLNNLSGLAWTTKEIRMTSDGTPWRPLVHVQDICEAVACVLDAPREVVHAQTFNVGATSDNYRVREIAEIVAAEFPGCTLSFGHGDRDNRSYRVSFDRIRERLPGFRTRWTARDGARQLHAMFESIRMPAETFRFRNYTRLAQLQHLLQTGQIDADLFWRGPADTPAALARAA